MPVHTGQAVRGGLFSANKLAILQPLYDYKGRAQLSPPVFSEGIMNASQALAYIASFSHLGAPVQDLSRVSVLLAALGNPQDKLRFVHVAGTNGKGSVVTYVAEAAQVAGYRVGSFTSPFIHCFADRIRVNGENIPDEALGCCCEMVRAAAPDLPFSQFEITMAIALLYFTQQRCDLVCWETGIGGRLDATNVVTPLVSVITSVSLDHTGILGNTTTEIAAQKAGIIKPGRPVVLSADNGADVRQVMAQTAREKDASLIQPDLSAFSAVSTSVFGSVFTYHGTEYHLTMPGKHQHMNALTAIETISVLNQLGICIPPDAVRQGLMQAHIGARIQVLCKEPLILLDGGHNADGMKALCDTLRADAPKPVFAVLGVLTTKDVRGVAEQIGSVAERIFCVDSFAPNAMDREELAAVCNGTPAKLSDAVEEAVRLAQLHHGTAVICGSLYLAAELPKCQFQHGSEKYFCMES